MAARSLSRCRCLRGNVRLVSPRGCLLKDVSLSGAYPSHLYVTPLDERARTLCLFFLGPWLADSSSLEPLDLERDLYTVAIVGGGDQGWPGNGNSSRDVGGRTKLAVPGRISIWLPAKISGRCLSISRDGLARAGPCFVEVPVLARGGPPVRIHHGGQLRCRNLAVGCRGGPHTSAKRACFVDLIVPTLSKPSGCP